jgi:transcriptional regulator with GAF, ATPase, and Fis domain
MSIEPAADGVTTGCDHTDQWIPLESLGVAAESFAGMVVQSALLRKMVTTLARLGPLRSTVLIQGESGTGKELVAHALHALGPTPEGPFIIFNCSNLVGSLAEAQLFGHVRGAFTDAREDSLGYFRSANGGTLFLDEVGELPIELQPKLLRVVETHDVQPVGSTKSYKTDIRLITATNCDLLAMVKAGRFRSDLYYRLNTMNIRIPPLRERRDGIGALVAHFVECSNRLFDRHVRLISQRALELLKSNDWPGNVREFSNVIQNAVMLADSDRLCIRELSERLGPSAVVDEPSNQIESHESLSARTSKMSLSREDAIKAALIRALRETGDNCYRAAQLLGVSRTSVYRMMARYRIARHQQEQPLRHVTD